MSTCEAEVCRCDKGENTLDVCLRKQQTNISFTDLVNSQAIPETNEVTEVIRCVVKLKL